MDADAGATPAWHHLPPLRNSGRRPVGVAGGGAAAGGGGLRRRWWGALPGGHEAPSDDAHYALLRRFQRDVPVVDLGAFRLKVDLAPSEAGLAAFHGEMAVDEVLDAVALRHNRDLVPLALRLLEVAELDDAPAG